MYCPSTVQRASVSLRAWPTSASAWRSASSCVISLMTTPPIMRRASSNVSTCTTCRRHVKTDPVSERNVDTTAMLAGARLPTPPALACIEGSRMTGLEHFCAPVPGARRAAQVQPPGHVSIIFVKDHTRNIGDGRGRRQSCLLWPAAPARRLGGVGWGAVAVQDPAVMRADGGDGPVRGQGDGPAPPVHGDEVMKSTQKQHVRQAGRAAASAGDQVMRLARRGALGAR